MQKKYLIIKMEINIIYYFYDIYVNLSILYVMQIFVLGFDVKYLENVLID